MANRTSLPSLDELSEHIANHIYDDMDIITINHIYYYDRSSAISDLKKVIKEAIIEKSLITNIGESRKDFLNL